MNVFNCFQPLIHLFLPSVAHAPQLEDCSQTALDAFVNNLATILDLDPSLLSVDCNFAGTNFINDGTRRRLFSNRLMLQVLGYAHLPGWPAKKGPVK